nr:hypothetical protein [Actinomycetales bacterium]
MAHSPSPPPGSRASAPESPVWNPEVGTGPGAPLTAIEALRHRATGSAAGASAPVPSGRPAPLLPAEPPGPRPLRVLGEALSGMFRADTVVGPIVDSTSRAQRPLTTGRRIVLLGAHPRAGVTTTATALTLLLSRVRRERLALLAIATDPTPVAGRTACPPRRAAEQVLAEIEAGRAENADEVAALMDQIAPNAWAVAHQQEARGLAVARLARLFPQYFGATVVDGGTAPSGSALSLVGSADAVLLVGDSSREGMHAVEVAFTNLMSTGRVAPDRLVVCLAQTVRTNRADLAWEAGVVRKQGIRSVGIPWDPHLAANRQVRPDFLAVGTLRSFTQLMAESIDTSMTAGGLR